MGSVQKGAMIAKNEFGTLERVDGTRTYIGSTTMQNGKVVTKRFRCDHGNEQKLIARWEKWQCRNEEDDYDEEELETMADEKKNDKKGKLCPFTKDICTESCAMYSAANFQCAIQLGGLGLWNMACNIMSLGNRDELELVALAIGDISKKLPEQWPVAQQTQTVSASIAKESSPIDEFLKEKDWLSFVNLTSKKVHADFKAMCANKYPEVTPMKERDLVDLILERYPKLDVEKISNGRIFRAKP